jgi:hypothetical protein
LRPHLLMLAAAALLTAGAVLPAAAQQTNPRAIEDAARLVQAYPAFLDRIEGNELVWKDGARMPIDDGKGPKTFEQRLDAPDLKDQFYAVYPLGRTGIPPARDFDPGRVRNAAFFEKMYGNCRNGGVTGKLTAVSWLPRHGGQKLMVTSVNGVAEKLAAVSRELDELPDEFLKYLKPSAGTYNCRVIAGTQRTSAHGFGIAVDINGEQADYWRWGKPAPDGSYPYKNRVPWEIIGIFEKHGFIWGGKWYHYDSMHFEYRPEIIAAAK